VAASFHKEASKPLRDVMMISECRLHTIKYGQLNIKRISSAATSSEVEEHPRLERFMGCYDPNPYKKWFAD